MLILYALLILAVCFVWLLIRFWPDDGPRCHCGDMPAYLLSDGTWECDGCREKRIGGKAPR